ncbi:MAG: pantoate--beta-alanine ligase [Candidatus Cloacimonetes bacterium]|nr:pantoate--beta-alanine ligase [Candidatus Cloacimonadota bacterium]
MKQITSLAEMQALVYPADAKIGFVPTMGYLHEGHLSLVERAKDNCDITVVSIYINPTQFGANEDLSSYPRDLERDLELLDSLGVDYVFIPTNEMMYPQPYLTWVNVDEYSELYCGQSRPGHFRGVATIVFKLLNLVRPHYMFMGEKDFQQLVILQKMLADLNHPCQIISCPIVREEDGLAKSSRNSYLSPEERIVARSLSQTLLQMKAMVAAGYKDATQLIKIAASNLENNGANVDYVELIDSRNLRKQTEIDDHSRMIMAAFVGKTRLIDNMLL